MDEHIVTIALATRLKRRVFASDIIKEEAEKLICENIDTINSTLISISFEDYGLILTLNNKDNLPTSDIAYFLRTATSAPLRNKYSNLNKMPSLWTRNYFCENGYMTNDTMAAVQEYFQQIKSR